MKFARGSTVLVLFTALVLQADDPPARRAGDGGKEPVRPATTHTVVIKDFRFTPAKLEIQAGDFVTWKNEDSAPHTATRTDAPAFDTGLLARGESKTILFTTPSGGGGFEYFCVPHPSTMRAHIVVKAAGSHLTHVGAGVGAGTKPDIRTAKTVTVRIKDRAPYYEPDVVEIQVGDTVTWVNDGALPHTASRDDAPGFDTGPLTTAKSHSVRFDAPSDGQGFAYFCRPHPYMKGRVVVKLPGSHLVGDGHGHDPKPSK